MTRKIAAGCFAAMFGLAVSAGAQTPSTPQTPSPSTPSTPSSPSTPSTPSSPTNPYPSSQSSTAERGGKEAKLTGCIQAGTSASSFELTNVKKGMSEHSAPASGAAADAASKNVKLTAASGVDLAAHVGHTVEVSGSWSKAGGAGDTSSASPSAASPSASSSSSGMGKEFTVKNVKMVSSTCSAGTN
jgi:hypothetical protein